MLLHCVLPILKLTPPDSSWRLLLRRPFSNRVPADQAGAGGVSRHARLQRPRCPIRLCNAAATQLRLQRGVDPPGDAEARCQFLANILCRERPYRRGWRDERGGKCACRRDLVVSCNPVELVTIGKWTFRKCRIHCWRIKFRAYRKLSTERSNTVFAVIRAQYCVLCWSESQGRTF